MALITTKSYLDKSSIAYKFRAKRFQFFQSFLDRIRHAEKKEVLKILDVDGVISFWELFNHTDRDFITVMNLDVRESSNYEKITVTKGDARDMSERSDNEFDVVFSNSVIEHVGDFSMQKKMADEVKRVGKYVFIQTPNYHFPIEPHYRFPFVQMMPYKLRFYLVKHYDLRLKKRRENPWTDAQTRANVDYTILLSEKEMKQLFPEEEIYREKFKGLTKSFIFYSKV